MKPSTSSDTRGALSWTKVAIIISINLWHNQRETIGGEMKWINIISCKTIRKTALGMETMECFQCMLSSMNVEINNLIEEYWKRLNASAIGERENWEISSDKKILDSLICISQPREFIYRSALKAFLIGFPNSRISCRRQHQKSWLRQY